MKLKKKQFAKLQQIAFTVNQIFPGTGVRLDKLITDIESVQKPKTIKEDPLVGAYIESLKEEARDMFFKDGKNAVENSLSDRRSTKGIRNKLRNLDPSIGRKINGVMDVETGSDLEKFLDPLMPPQIGDIGYFWDEPCLSAVFGKINLILESFPVKYQVVLNGEFVRAYTHFSKTPPELK